jgi:flagellum-specific ATP synthase
MTALLDISSYRSRIAQVQSCVKSGTVAQVRGLVIEAYGPNLRIGDMCRVMTRADGEIGVLAEVVGFSEHRMLLMPLDEMHEVGPGSKVIATRHEAAVPLPEGLTGRIVNALGEPIDGKGDLQYDYRRKIRGASPDPLTRKPIKAIFRTGVRSIDSFTAMGHGQRIGLFSGSGVGKSTLMGMLARGSHSDVNVIALIGERGREVREFIETSLSADALARSVVVVSTSDEPAMRRLRAAYMATSIAESFRDQGANVLFMMDSVTRFAMAQREIGLSVGEPPANRGYPPSVFSILPRLLERTGNSNKGSITAYYTVLVEGDDMNEPISDAVRGILDGHIVLSRKLATANIFPAVDVLESVSRLSTTVCNEDQLALVSKAREMLAVYRENEDLINIGAYVKGSNPVIDLAIQKRPALVAFLKQGMREISTTESTFNRLKEILK